MVPLLPVSTATGGLQVIPRSHTEAAKTEPWLKRSLTHFANLYDFVDSLLKCLQFTVDLP